MVADIFVTEFSSLTESPDDVQPRRIQLAGSLPNLSLEHLVLRLELILKVFHPQRITNSRHEFITIDRLVQ